MTDLKFNTFQKFIFTAEYWNATVTTDAAGNATTTLKFSKVINCSIRPDGSGRTFLYTPEKLFKGDHILSLKDTDGTVIDGKEYQITVVEPVLNVYGHKDYMRYWLMGV